MNDIEQKALALIKPGASCEVNFENISILATALTCAIEQHEAFRQEVSDELIKQGFINASTGIGRFIIFAPKPDPLVEALNESGVILAGPVAKDLRAALEARGLTITTLEKD